MQKFVALLFCLSVVSGGVLNSCVYHDFPDYKCETELSFADDIRPIIETKCAIPGCHNGDMGGDLNWTDFSQFHKRAASGLVKYRVTNRIMPPAESPAGPLTPEQINTIACWADQGALNN